MDECQDFDMDDIDEKFKFDLMGPPPGKLSPARADFNVFEPYHNLHGPGIELATKVNKDKAEEMAEEKRSEIAVMKDKHHIVKYGEKDTDLRKQAVIKQTFDYQLEKDTEQLQASHVENEESKLESGKDDESVVDNFMQDMDLSIDISKTVDWVETIVIALRNNTNSVDFSNIFYHSQFGASLATDLSS